MPSRTLTILAALVAITALADPGPIGNEIPPAEQAPDKAVSESADEAREPEPFKVPAGYQAKQRGKKVVYCKKTMESGTRFAQEKCYSEEQLRVMSAERDQEQSKFDQSRKICASADSCAGN